MAETLEPTASRSRSASTTTPRGRASSPPTSSSSKTPSGSTDPVVIYYSGHGGRTALDGWEDPPAAGPALPPALPRSLRHGRQQRDRLPRPAVGRAQRPAAPADGQDRERDDHPRLLPLRHHVPRRRPHAQGRAPLVPVRGRAPAAGHAGGRERSAARLDDSNPLAVRVVACDPTQSAYERPSSLGGRHGALTEQLVPPCASWAIKPLTWRVLGNRIRRTITTSLPTQRPEVEGPSDRLLFSLETRSAANALPVAVADGAVRIEAPDSSVCPWATGTSCGRPMTRPWARPRSSASTGHAVLGVPKKPKSGRHV